MDKTTALAGPPSTDAEYELAVDQYLSEMKRMTGHMAEQQQEIETLRAETNAILTDIMQTLKVPQHGMKLPTEWLRELKGGYEGRRPYGLERS